MTDKEFRCFLNLLMYSDPWPIPNTGSALDEQTTLIDYAEEQSQERGFSDWIEAFYKLGKEVSR